ncbi:LRR domain containing protein [Parasponia andersonii]|uniref:LRR domain containing protein n=1 Tax=Parasponia andersonii TaxID=3476 RepID=A0A2P5A6S0_PARAD|nr:LRR domain containing protein [Parasponia andersonii]
MGHIPSLGNLTKLTHLAISSRGLRDGSLSRITKLTKFALLALADSNIDGEVPSSLGNLTQLETLNLINNNFSGQIPTQLMNLSTLTALDLCSNQLTGPIPAQLINLTKLNWLQGLFPVPPPSILYYTIPNNSVIGEIPPSICSSGSFQILDLSYNNLSGKVPECFCNFRDSLLGHNLSCNQFVGVIPHTWRKGSRLRMINLSQNKFQGQLPRSLAKSSMLESLDISGKTRIKILQNTECHEVQQNESVVAVPQCVHKFPVSEVFAPQVYSYSMIMTNKGMEMVYEKVQTEFIAIDMSSNRFQGEIRMHRRSHRSSFAQLFPQFSEFSQSGSLQPISQVTTSSQGKFLSN